VRVRSVCAKLGLEYGEPAYYHDIFVWLPDERWGAEAMPPCIECESAQRVAAHAFQTGAHGHYGRRICGLKDHNFIISRRYICHCCERKAKAAKQAAEEAGLHVEEAEEDAAAPATPAPAAQTAADPADPMDDGFGDDFGVGDDYAAGAQWTRPVRRPCLQPWLRHRRPCSPPLL